MIISANAKFTPICSETKVRQLRSSDMSSHKILTYFIGIVENIQSLEIEFLRWLRPFGLEQIALCKRVNQKKSIPTHYPLTFPLFISVTRAKKLQSLGAVHRYECTFYCLSLFNATKGLGSLIPAHTNSRTSDFLHLCNLISFI